MHTITRYMSMSAVVFVIAFTKHIVVVSFTRTGGGSVVFDSHFEFEGTATGAYLAALKLCREYAGDELDEATFKAEVGAGL